MQVKDNAIGQSRFKLERKGEFSVNTVGKFHCGTKDSLKVRYEFSCEMSADSLDHRGFLFDQMKVAQFFGGLKSTDLSCEAFTLFCARKLFALVKSENKQGKIISMSLTLSPEPFEANLTFSWN